MSAATATKASRPIHHHHYDQVLCAIVLGVLIEYFFPAIGASPKPLGGAARRRCADSWCLSSVSFRGT